ncbi:exocyst complex component Sec3-domain-containing protein [Stachybotrys elegans]|uniref:Exocyst complex component Sec3-domain-containing protein n=1 Tax=Stachybotrys elegans TaxID=80388 RepID=A0A8K0SH26_9HYPO|nr:exocyst complex component Sec3-domain-containing protein [Stachybotrys elegans]
MDRANGAGPGGAAAATRAERFEDEKRRIIDSCFSKKDIDGSFIENYITHIRVTEYSTHPSTPAPPQARTPESEKPRVIIVAVRKSGRVRMHKTKENPNGTFSIGKTWNLDDLTRIESYTSTQTNFNYREWAGDNGFTVTLGKPYFWMAQTDKEKKFFVASLIKIYGKYTGGKVPDLAGFDQKEYDQVVGAGTGRRQVGPSTGTPPPRPSPAPELPSTQQSFSSSQTVSPPAEAPRFPRAAPVRNIANGSGASPAGSFDSTASRDRLPPRWAAQPNKSQESLANSIAARSEDTASLPPRSRNGLPPGPGYGRFGDSRESSEPPSLDPRPPSQSRSPSQPPRSPSQPRPGSQPQQDDKLPPERRRPPMDPSRPQDRDLVPPPLMSPAAKRDPIAPPPRSVERMNSRKGSTGQQSASPSLTGSFKDRDIPQPLVPGPPATPIPEPPTQTPDAPKPVSPSKEVSDPAQAQFTNSPTASPIAEVASPTEETEEARPGLGPMIRSKKSKNDVAGAFWKAASTAAAFKPRKGGAGERLRQAAEKISEGPDGITSVVPAPPRPASRGADPTPEPAMPAERSSLLPEVKISVPNSSRPSSMQGDSVSAVTKKEADKSPVAAKEAPAASQEPPRRSIVTGNDAKYLQSLGINPTVLDERSEEFSKWLDYFGWVPGNPMRSINMDDMKADIEREVNKAQAGGWLARFREEDERVDAIKRGIDTAIAECEELDNLLTLYAVELSTLSEDITYIEAQGQGLQVQTANQKLLKKELESLLETCAITSQDLEALRMAPLENPRGLEDVEAALVTLFKAMIKIDPSLGGNEPTKNTATTLDSDQPSGLNSDYGQMRIVQEKKQMYLEESAYFMRRLREFMGRQIEEAFAETKRSLEGALSRKVDSSHQDAGRSLLWKYSPLMLYARDADLENWNRILQVYQDKSQPVYKNQFQAVITVSRKNARKLTGEEAELLFSSQVEKQQEGVATTARKLTVKRSQTLARALRSPLADGSSKSNADKSGGDTRSMPFEIFAGVLDDLLPLVEMEQNFIIDFFHATTLEVADFPDVVAATRPNERRGGDLRRRRLMEPDRELARRVTRSMEAIFEFLEQDIQRLLEWVIGQDPLQGIGILATFEKKLSETSQTNQDYLNTLIQKLQGNLDTRFRRFVDEQVRAIEETKVKIKKRKGVISFFRVFPAFSAAVENMMTGVDAHLPLRRSIDREYDRIVKTMFDSLKVIARENPSVGHAGGTADPEDKEALNYHILLIENMNHFTEEVDTRGLEILEDWKEQADAEYHEHMGLYLNAVMRRPLGKLLDQLENIEAQLQSGRTPSAVAAQPSNSKTIFNKVLGNYDSKEVRRGIEALRKRVEKHFGDADEPGQARGLVGRVLQECEGFYGDVETRIGRITTDVYEGDVLFEWPRADVKAAFR